MLSIPEQGPSAMRHALRILAVLTLTAAAPATLHAQPPKSARVDKYGDPLPDGAIVRLGSLRFADPGGIRSVAVSPDGKVVASGTYHSKAGAKGEAITIRLWDTKTGAQIRAFSAPGPVPALAFDPAGHTLFAGGFARISCLDADTGKLRWEKAAPSEPEKRIEETERILVSKNTLISIHRASVGFVDAKPGSAGAVDHPQHAILLWDRITGKPLPLPKSLDWGPGRDKRITPLFHEHAVSPDGRFVASLVSDAELDLRVGKNPNNVYYSWKYLNRRLQVVALDSGKLLYTLGDLPELLKALAFSEDGELLTLAAGKEIWLIDTAKGGKRVLTKALLPGTSTLTFVGNKQLAALAERDAIEVWDIATGQRLDKHSVKPHHFESAHGGTVVAAIRGNSVHLVDRVTGKELVPIPGTRGPAKIRYTLHAKDTLICRAGRTAYLWDTRSWKPREGLSLPGYWHSTELDVDISIERGLYVKEGQKEGLELADLRTDQLIRPLRDCDDQAHLALFSADGDRLMTEEGEFLRVYDAKTGKPIAKWPRSNFVHYAGFHIQHTLSPRGSYLAQHQKHETIAVVDLAAQTQILLFPRMGAGPKRGSSILGFAFSHDETILFGETHQRIDNDIDSDVGERAGVTLWDLKTGTILQEIVPWPAFRVFFRGRLIESKADAFALSADHRYLALAESGSATIQIWEVASATKRGELVGHDGAIVDLAFSPDGRQLVSSSEDTTLLVWDLNRPLQPVQLKDRANADELAIHWTTLFERDARRAETAMWRLVHAAKDSVPFLRAKLWPAKRPDPKHVQAMLLALGSEDFPERSHAMAELDRFGERILFDLEGAVKEKNPLEKQRRLETLLRRARDDAKPFGTMERVGQWRALEVLERIGGKEATQIVRDLAAGAPGSQLTLAAQATLERAQP